MDAQLARCMYLQLDMETKSISTEYLVDQIPDQPAMYILYIGER